MQGLMEGLSGLLKTMALNGQSIPRGFRTGISDSFALPVSVNRGSILLSQVSIMMI